MKAYGSRQMGQLLKFSWARRFSQLITSTTTGTTTGLRKQKKRVILLNIRHMALWPLMERKNLRSFSSLDRKSTRKPTIRCLGTPSYHE
uniref:Uncharacterized protein n=1 Tax=Lepeophtheirus salmonis TaxID=72036 RepID=A0A0K2U7N9_LEPSM